MKKIILTVGMSCSGKTSWAEEFVRNRVDWVNLNRDNIRFALFTNGERDWTNYKFNRENEKRVSGYINQCAFDACVNRKNIIVSDTNLSEKIRNKWKKWAEDNGYEYEEKPFIISWDEAVKRNNQRLGGISKSILRSQYYKMQEYLGEYKYVPDNSLKPCFLIDIDGTVADKSPKRNYYDWDKVGLDLPKKEIIAMVHGLIQSDYTPIFLSGRDGSCVEETYNWVRDHIMMPFLEDGEGFHLFMRTAGDMRKDYIVKRELFEKYVKGKFDVKLVLDDRPQVINNCWLDIGLPNVISVTDQNLEF